MFKHIKVFFYPTVVTYSYNHSKESVISMVNEIFTKKVTLEYSIDMKGHFHTSDCFIINVESPLNTRGIKYGSTLVGEIKELVNNSTQIETKAKPSIFIYIFFFLAIVFGLVYLFNFIRTGIIGYIYWSVAFVFIAPAFLIGLANVANTSVRDRYKRYIDNELKASPAPHCFERTSVLPSA